MRFVETLFLSSAANLVDQLGDVLLEPKCVCVCAARLDLGRGDKGDEIIPASFNLNMKGEACQVLV